MNVEAASDVDPRYQVIVIVHVRVGDVWVGIMWACSLIFVRFQGNICVGEWCYEDVESS